MVSKLAPYNQIRQYFKARGDASYPMLKREYARAKQAFLATQGITAMTAVHLEAFLSYVRERYPVPGEQSGGGGGESGEPPNTSFSLIGSIFGQPKPAAQEPPEGEPPKPAAQQAPEGEPPKPAAQQVPEGEPPKPAAQQAPAGEAPKPAAQQAPAGEAPKPAAQEAPKPSPEVSALRELVASLQERLSRMDAQIARVSAQADRLDRVAQKLEDVEFVGDDGDNDL